MATKKQKVTNVPNLRFPGFEGEWDEKTLGDLSEISSGGTPSRSNPLFWNGDIPWVSTTLIDFNIIYDTEERITEEGLKKSSAKLFPKGSLLMAMYGQGKTRGKIAVLGIEACTNQACASIITNKDILDSLFLFQNLSKRYEEIRDLSNQGGQQNLSGTIIKGIKISFPTLIEQERIAAFLSLIDDRIATQNKIIERLETLIKGLNEQLFNQKLRFKDDNGNDFSDWEIKSLGQVFSYKITNSYSREKLNYEEGNVKNIHYGDIHTQYRTLFNAQKENAPYINLDVNISKIEEENYCKKGDVIIADASEDLKDVGKSIELVSLNGQKILAGLHTILARPMGDIFSIGFCGYLFKSQKIRQQIQNEAQGSKVLSISASRLSKVVLCIPCLGEQTKIVDFLSGIDEKIETEKRVLKWYESQKKYFLHELFI